jgi:uncharacterized protein (DUF302 family)
VPETPSRAAPGPSTDGINTVTGPHPVAQTVDKIKQELSRRGLRLFAQIDHAANAADAGHQLRPMLLLIFGNAQAGTPLIDNAPTIGLDLPLKILVWQGFAGGTRITHASPRHLARRHGVSDHESTVAAMEKLLASLVQRVAASG